MCYIALLIFGTCVNILIPFWDDFDLFVYFRWTDWHSCITFTSELAVSATLEHVRCFLISPQRTSRQTFRSAKTFPDPPPPPPEKNDTYSQPCMSMAEHIVFVVCPMSFYLLFLCLLVFCPPITLHQNIKFQTKIHVHVSESNSKVS